MPCELTYYKIEAVSPKCSFQSTQHKFIREGGGVRPQAELGWAGTNRMQRFPLVVKVNPAVIHWIIVRPENQLHINVQV